MSAANSHPEAIRFAQTRAAEQILGGLGDGHAGKFREFYAGLLFGQPNETRVAGELAKGADVANVISREFRANTRKYQRPGQKLPTPTELVKSGALAKSVLDVGTLTNLANVTGGQSLGYLSLDTRLARGTVRPNAFTLYQALPKSQANQVVDYWAYNSQTGGAIEGGAFSSFSSVSTGTLSTSVGSYQLENVTLKLAQNARAMTIALAAQNSFVDIPSNETANAALNVLSSINWANYWGDATLFPNMFNGLSNTIPTANVYSFQDWYNSYGTAQGLSHAQALYNMIYDVAAEVTSASSFGRITHAFMSPIAAASLQSLVTTTLNNVLQLDRQRGNIVNGQLEGMLTNFGEIQFPIDLFINIRDIPAQARPEGYATTTNPTKPTSVTAAASGAASPGSAWTAAYAPSATGSIYVYAVASLDTNSNESTLTYSAVATGVTAGGAYTLTIAAPGAADAAAYRVYRSGLGYNVTSSQNPADFRYIGTVAASGSSSVTFVDNNTHIPGSETIFLLDMADEDQAIDYRYMLPMSRINLYAGSLYMPWAVATIGALRVRVPKFHGMITNYVTENPSWNPLATNL